jgi:hypothetical protein
MPVLPALPALVALTFLGPMAASPPSLSLRLADSAPAADPCYDTGVEYHGGGLDNPMVEQVEPMVRSPCPQVGDPGTCQQLCQARPGCSFFTWVRCGPPPSPPPPSGGSGQPGGVLQGDLLAEGEPGAWRS